MSEWFFPKALVEGRVANNVRVSSDAGVITKVTVDAQHDRHSFSGVAVPGFANTHSHVFHRGLRGAGEGEDFWSWRTEMYRLANRLDPDSYHRLARAAFAEMVAAGYTSVGEFHYVHHRPDGTPYPHHDMELAVVNAAANGSCNGMPPENSAGSASKFALMEKSAKIGRASCRERVCQYV